MGMLKRRGEVDLERAAVYFVRWWREEGGLLAAKDSFVGYRRGVALPRLSGVEDADISSSSSDYLTSTLNDNQSGVLSQARAGAALAHTPRVEGWGFDFQWDSSGVGDQAKRMDSPDAFVQEKMEACIDEYLAMIQREEREEENVSPTQVKKKAMAEEKARRKARYASK